NLFDQTGGDLGFAHHYRRLKSRGQLCVKGDEREKCGPPAQLLLGATFGGRRTERTAVVRERKGQAIALPAAHSAQSQETAIRRPLVQVRLVYLHRYLLHFRGDQLEHPLLYFSVKSLPTTHLVFLEAFDIYFNRE